MKFFAAVTSTLTLLAFAATLFAAPPPKPIDPSSLPTAGEIRKEEKQLATKGKKGSARKAGKKAPVKAAPGSK